MQGHGPSKIQTKGREMKGKAIGLHSLMPEAWDRALVRAFHSGVHSIHGWPGSLVAGRLIWRGPCQSPGHDWPLICQSWSPGQAAWPASCPL